MGVAVSVYEFTADALIDSVYFGASAGMETKRLGRATASGVGAVWSRL